jgi:oxygen-dependent protoporphyrinogen oxidase
MFSWGRCPELRRLAEELGLEVVRALPRGAARYLWTEGKLRKFPSFSLLFPLLPALLREWRAPSRKGDETIAQFAERRVGKRAAELLFDPLTLGVYAGSMRELSILSCFPELKRWEEAYGSLTKGLLKERGSEDAGLFTFAGGVQSLTDALARKLQGRIHYGEEAMSLREDAQGVEVVTQRGRWRGERLICAAPPQASAVLFPQAREAFAAIPMLGVTVVNLGYPEDVLPVKGFGYLVPSCAQEEILGTVFDSAVFPLQSQETRLAVMIRGTDKTDAAYTGIALRAVQRHLRVQAPPAVSRVCRAPAAIPQYAVGHAERMERLRQWLAAAFPRCRLVGNYLEGASVNACAARGRAVTCI